MSATIGLTDEDLERRRKCIGASDVAAILGVSPWRSPWDVWADKTGRLQPWEGNEATKIGQYLESSVLSYAEAQVGDLERNIRVECPGTPIVATLDARTIAEGIPVEVKTAGMTGPLHGDWGDAMTDHVPDHYLLQVHTQLLCTGAEVAWLFALLGGRGVVQYEIPRSDSLCDSLTEQLCEWWNRHIVEGVEPSRERATLEIVKRLRRVPERAIELGDSVGFLLRTKEHLAAEAKDLKARQEETDKMILLALGDAEVGVTASGERVSYLEQHRKGYTVEPSTYRVMRITKAKVAK